MDQNGEPRFYKGAKNAQWGKYSPFKNDIGTRLPQNENKIEPLSHTTHKK